MRRLKLRRVLEFEGPEDWIEMLQEESWLKPNETKKLYDRAFAREVERKVEVVEWQEQS